MDNPIITTVKLLIAAKAELLDIDKKLVQLESTKNQVSETMFSDLHREYSEKKNALEQQIGALQPKVDMHLADLDLSLKSSEKKKGELETKKGEIRQLFEQGALSKVDHDKKMSEITKQLTQLQKSITARTREKQNLTGYLEGTLVEKKPGELLLDGLRRAAGFFAGSKFIKYAAPVIIVLVISVPASIYVYKKYYNNNDAREQFTEYRVNARGGLRMRMSPGIEGEYMLTIPHGSSVAFIEEQREEMQVTGVPGKWTRVTWNGNTGWVFGGFLRKMSLMRDKGQGAAIGDGRVFGSIDELESSIRDMQSSINASSEFKSGVCRLNRVTLKSTSLIRMFDGRYMKALHLDAKFGNMLCDYAVSLLDNSNKYSNFHDANVSRFDYLRPYFITPHEKVGTIYTDRLYDITFQLMIYHEDTTYRKGWQCVALINEFLPGTPSVAASGNNSPVNGELLGGNNSTEPCQLPGWDTQVYGSRQVDFDMAYYPTMAGRQGVVLFGNNPGGWNGDRQSISQTITVPSNANTLLVNCSFTGYGQYGLSFNGRLQVFINSAMVADQSPVNTPDCTIRVDVSAYRGKSITLRIEKPQINGSHGDTWLDYVRLQ